MSMNVLWSQLFMKGSIIQDPRLHRNPIHFHGKHNHMLLHHQVSRGTASNYFETYSIVRLISFFLVPKVENSNINRKQQQQQKQHHWEQSKKETMDGWTEWIETPFYFRFPFCIKHTAPIDTVLLRAFSYFAFVQPSSKLCLYIEYGGSIRM